MMILVTLNVLSSNILSKLEGIDDTSSCHKIQNVTDICDGCCNMPHLVGPSFIVLTFFQLWQFQFDSDYVGTARYWMCRAILWQVVKMSEKFGRQCCSRSTGNLQCIFVVSYLAFRLTCAVFSFFMLLIIWGSNIFSPSGSIKYQFMPVSSISLSQLSSSV